MTYYVKIESGLVAEFRLFKSIPGPGDWREVKDWIGSIGQSEDWFDWGNFGARIPDATLVTLGIRFDEQGVYYSKNPNGETKEITTLDTPAPPASDYTTDVPPFDESLWSDVSSSWVEAPPVPSLLYEAEWDRVTGAWTEGATTITNEMKLAKRSELWAERTGAVLPNLLVQTDNAILDALRGIIQSIQTDVPV